MSGSQIIESPSSSDQDEMGLLGSYASETLKRYNAVAGKEPYVYDVRPEFVEPDYPDLADYFLEFNLSYDEQIKMCRSYASYLSSLMPKKKRRKSEKAKISPKRQFGTHGPVDHMFQHE